LFSAINNICYNGDVRFTTPEFEGRNNTFLNNIEFALRLAEERCGSSNILSELKDGNQTQPLEARWWDYYFSHLVSPEMRAHERSAISKFKLDGWGHPFRYEFKADLIHKNAAYSLTNKDTTILVWSIGNNGVDELGRGDDVFLGSIQTNSLGELERY
jgi:hypothetical protein